MQNEQLDAVERSLVAAITADQHDGTRLGRGQMALFGKNFLVHDRVLDPPKAHHSVSPSTIVTASEIGGEGRLRRCFCRLRSSLSALNNDRSRFHS